MVRSTRMAHEWPPPAEVALNWPSGASAWPQALAPQQVAVPSVVIAHEWPTPLEIAGEEGVASDPPRGASSLHPPASKATVSVAPMKPTMNRGRGIIRSFPSGLHLTSSSWSQPDRLRNRGSSFTPDLDALGVRLRFGET